MECTKDVDGIGFFGADDCVFDVLMDRTGGNVF